MIYINHIFDLYFRVQFCQLSSVLFQTFECGRVGFVVIYGLLYSGMWLFFFIIWDVLFIFAIG